MKETLLQQRLDKIHKLKDELTQWQQIVVNQQLQIDRLNCTVSAMISTLVAKGRFEKFDVNKLNAMIDKMVKARLEKVKQAEPKEANASSGKA